MAVDKLVDSTQLDTDLTSVANAIRTKGGTSAQLAFPAGFVQAIADIPTGGGFSPFETYTTSFVSASDGNSVSFTMPTGKNIVFMFGCVEDPQSYVSAEYIGKITGFGHDSLNAYFGNKDGGFYLSFGTLRNEITSISTASAADNWANGVTHVYDTQTGLYTISNTRGQTFLLGKTYRVWAFFG